MDVFTPAYRRLVPELLGIEWSAQEGMSAQEFGARCAQSPAAQHFTETDLQIPVALSRFYLAVGGCEEVLETDHFFFAPEEFDVRDGHLMFLEDAEESTVWGIPVDQLSLPDPLVAQRSSGADAETGAWRPLEGTVSEFITDLFAWMLETAESESGNERDDEDGRS